MWNVPEVVFTKNLCDLGQGVLIFFFISSYTLMMQYLFVCYIWNVLVYSLSNYENKL
jgi:hypothetical protein